MIDKNIKTSIKKKPSLLNKRKGRDVLARILFYLNFLSWGLLLLILFIFHRAQPEFESFFDRFYQLQLRTDWDHMFLYYSTILVISGIIISIGGLVLGIFRGRRKEDSIIALIITGLTSAFLLGLTVFKG